MNLSEHTIIDVIEDRELLALVLDLICDKEYTLARNASIFFRNISIYLSTNQLDLNYTFKSLTALEQSDDIFFVNLDSLKNLITPSNPTILADFMRRGLVTRYLNPVLERDFAAIHEQSMINLNTILRHLSESKLVQIQFSD